MKSFDISHELKAIYSESARNFEMYRNLRESDVLRWCTAGDCTRSHVFEEIAKFLALGFNSSELSFEFCDAVVNDLFGPYTDTPKPKSQLFWDVYLAFDEGEYYHGNNRNDDPVETYTRPAIIRIVEALEKSAAKKPDLS